MKKLQKWLLLLLILWGVCSALFLLVRYITGAAKPVHYARLSEFFVCEGSDPVTGFPEEPLTAIPTTIDAVYACGHLEVDGSIPLAFLLIYEENSKDWFVPKGQFQTGYVLELIPQQLWAKPGHYRLEAWWYRTKLSSTEFMVIGNPD